MINATPELFPQDISPEEWSWVQGLIQDVQRLEQRDTFAKNLFGWDLAVQQFRKVEMKRIILGSPTENDILHHKICLHALLTIGNAIVLDAKRFSDEELAALKVTRQQIAAYVSELEQSYREWHHGISEAELAKVRESIFSAAP